MSGLNKGNGNGRSSGSSGTSGSKAIGPDLGLERILQRLVKKLPEGYSASIEKTGRVVVACTDHQLEELEKSSKARVYVRREGGELKATKVTPMDQKPNGNEPNQPPIPGPRRKSDDHGETTPTRRKKKRSKVLRF